MKSKKITSIALLTAGLMLGSTSLALAEDATPAPVSSPSAYQTQLAAYKVALLQYQFAKVNADINYRTAVQKYESDWDVTMAAFQSAQAAFEAKKQPIQEVRRATVNAASAAFLAATTGTPTDAVIKTALTAYWTATKAANTAYETAITALGAGPVKPVKPAAPVKPVDPTKPVAPVKPSK